MKKAQIKMFETIGVLVIFFFLLVIAAVFYTKIQKADLESEIKKQSELASTQIAERAFFMPELDCSFVGIRVPNCFDQAKINAFMGLSETTKTDVYFESFGESTLTIKKIWPGAVTNYTIYSYRPSQIGSQLKSQSPVLIYDAKTGKYLFGIIEVISYVK